AGIADVQIHEEIHRGKVGDTFFIPLEAKHRLSNPGDSDLTIIEVQQGGYLGEDDIVRLEDNYGRAD
ncbi:MAG: mannose-6-phosphate isomerase, partial [Pelagibacteraceae bacterium]